MESWIEAVCAELGIDAEVQVAAILEVAKDAAHNVERPAAPVSTYLMGIAVASGMDAGDVASRIGTLARGWNPPA